MQDVRGLEGKVALITGAARGQGRAHAARLASHGVNIIAVDLCADIASMDYPNASPADLDETVAQVETVGAKIVASQADVRDHAALEAAFAAGFDVFGRVDIVIANAGIVRLGTSVDPIAEWRDIIDVNLTGAWQTVQVALPAMIEGGRGGSIVLTSSTAGLKGTGSDKAGAQAYTASKRGLVGLMQVLANDLAKHWIRVNTIHPTGVATGMVLNEAMQQLFGSGDASVSAMLNALPVDMLQPEDIAGAVAWLVSDEARFVTGVALPLDAGFTVR